MVREWLSQLKEDIYYRNMIFFVQPLRDLVVSQNIDIVKANFTTSLCVVSLDQYISELDKSSRDNLRKTLGMGKWIKNLIIRFKIPTVMALGLLVDKKYSFSNIGAQHEPAQYVCAIMRYSNCAIILNVSNHLFFQYKNLAPELCVFIILPVESTKASEFITQLEKKRKCWTELFFCLFPRYTFQFSPRPPILHRVSSSFHWSLPLQVEKYI